MKPCILKNVQLDDAPSDTAQMTGNLQVISKMETASQKVVIIWYAFMPSVPK